MAWSGPTFLFPSRKIKEQLKDTVNLALDEFVQRRE